MTIDEMRKVLQHVRFQDWRLRVDTEFQSPRAFLQWQFHSNGYQTSRKWMLSGHMTTSELVQTAFKAVVTALEHEAREFFTYRGATVFGPHFNVEDLVDLARSGKVDVRAVGP